MNKVIKFQVRFRRMGESNWRYKDDQLVTEIDEKETNEKEIDWIIRQAIMKLYPYSWEIVSYSVQN